MEEQKKGKSNVVKIIVIVAVVLLILGGGCAAGVYILGKKGLEEIQENVNETEVRAKMRDIQLALELYSERNLKYPDSLDDLEDELAEVGAETVIEGKEVEYEKISKHEYKLTYTFDDGTKLELD